MVATSHIFNIPFARVKGRGEDEGELSRVERGEGGEKFHFQLRYRERFNNFTAGAVKYRRNSQDADAFHRFPPVNSVKLITRIWSKRVGGDAASPSAETRFRLRGRGWKAEEVGKLVYKSYLWPAPCHASTDESRPVINRASCRYELTCSLELNGNPRPSEELRRISKIAHHPKLGF